MGVFLLFVFSCCFADVTVLDEVAAEEEASEYSYAKQLELASAKSSNMTERERWRYLDGMVKRNRIVIQGAERKIRESGFAMWGNIIEFFRKTAFQVSTDALEYGPHFQNFFDSIPADAYRKSALGNLNLALKLNQQNCGKITLQLNPIRPVKPKSNGRETNRGSGEEKQEEDEDEDEDEVEEEEEDEDEDEVEEEEEEFPMTLSKFGKIISKWASGAENTMVEYIYKSIPVMCQQIEAWLKQRIAEVENMEPEDVKKKFKI